MIQIRNLDLGLRKFAWFKFSIMYHGSDVNFISNQSPDEDPQQLEKFLLMMQVQRLKNICKKHDVEVIAVNKCLNEALDRCEYVDR